MTNAKSRSKRPRFGHALAWLSRARDLIGSGPSSASANASSVWAMIARTFGSRSADPDHAHNCDIHATAELLEERDAYVGAIWLSSFLQSSQSRIASIATSASAMKVMKTFVPL